MLQGKEGEDMNPFPWKNPFYLQTMIQIYPWIRELTSVHLQPLQCWNTILQSFTFMRANILLIMKDLFIPLLLWVLLLCHKRPSQKLNGNTVFVFGNHSAKLRSSCLTILLFTSVFHSLKLNNLDGMYGMSLALVTDHRQKVKLLWPSLQTLSHNQL